MTKNRHRPFLTGILAGAACLLVLSMPAAAEPRPASHLVFFKDGRSLEVKAVRMEEGKAILTMPGGSLVAFSSDRITHIEKTTPPPVATPEPVELAPPVPPAPTADTGDQGVDLDRIILDTATRYELEPRLLRAVIAVESNFRVDAVSPKGAQGLMQLMPATARELEVMDPFDPVQNIDGGARYLKQLIDANDGQYWKALAAYNAGSGRVARYDGLPPYRETIGYIQKVLELYGSPTDNR